MEKIWLGHYPKGVPSEINPDAYASLVDLFDRSCRVFSDKPAFANRGTVMTYSDLSVAANQLAAFLQKKWGCQRGERIAIMMPNLLQYPVAIFAAFIAGLTVVNVNPLYTSYELEHQLKDAGVTHMIVLSNFADTLAKIIDKTAIKNVMITDVGDLYPFFKRVIVNAVVKYVKKMVPVFNIPHAISWRAAMIAGKNKTPDPVHLTGEDIAFLQYTGGTTGVAKGAILTHRNMVANLEQASAWLHPFLLEGDGIIITALPLYHIFSLTANCLTFLKNGALNVLITNPRDIKGFIKEMSSYRFTVMTGVNTLFAALLNQPAFAKLDFSAFVLALGGGMAVQRVVAERFREVTGHPLLEAYGLTETSPAVTINPLNMTTFNGSIGLPVSSTEISIRNEMNEELGIGEIGELCVKGPQVMAGYWQQPEETAGVMTADGYLRTGDLAYIDAQGFIYLKERKKDMILVSGFNVYPNEVEEVIAQHPGVLEVAVIGVPNGASGEMVKAVVVKKDPALTAADLTHYCRDYLTGYKVPKVIEFQKELPKSNVGKILRKALREESLLREKVVSRGSKL